MRVLFALVLLAIAGACLVLSIAASELPRESRWAFRVIYGIVGLACLSGAARHSWVAARGRSSRRWRDRWPRV